ncbi:MAPEG family protein [Microvirga sp. 2MCAF38]|uniref:MAPEG family protein n=1 Tax=Microvirga sp. 2MCAF38 TaxID=3232989 RepID=UPI003F9B8572
MSVTAVLLPVFVQVGLTFVLLFWMARSRIGALRAGELKVKDVALGERNWPTRAQQVSNCFQNQFETPVLFYALVAFALITRKADLVFVVLSWMWVASRIVHAGIHATTNRISPRFKAFAVGVVILLLMWIIFALRLISAEAGI